jgi:hypothetical protein
MRPSCGIILYDLVLGKNLTIRKDNKGKEEAGKAKSFGQEGRKRKKSCLHVSPVKHTADMCFSCASNTHTSNKFTRKNCVQRKDWKEVGNIEILVFVVYLTFAMYFYLSLS